MRVTILIISNNLEIIEMIRKLCEKEKWLFMVTMMNNEVLDIINDFLIDLVVIDDESFGVYGFELCRSIRKNYNIPILVLSDNTDKRIEYLKLDINDVFSYTFQAVEIPIRINMLLKYGNGDNLVKNPEKIRLGEMEIYADTRLVKVNRETVLLTQIEHNILQVLLYNADKVCSYDYILKKVWGFEYAEERTYLHTYIQRLRIKLGILKTNPDLIQNIRSVGYILNSVAAHTL